MNLGPCRRPDAGFARSDVLSLLGAAALLAGLFLTAGAGTRSTSENVFCRSNFRHLGEAWQSYALDHTSRLIGTPAGADTSRGREVWATGFVSWDVQLGGNDEQSVLTPAFVPYVGRDPRVFRCPADRYLSPIQVSRRWRSRVRSYSMNGYFGSESFNIGTLRQFIRMEDVPDPAGYFVLLEEHPDSINDPTFFTAVQGPSGWTDWPGSFHERSANFLFADAHVETHRWESERTVVPVRYQFPGVTPSGRDPDFRWAYARTSIVGP